MAPYMDPSVHNFTLSDVKIMLSFAALLCSLCTHTTLSYMQLLCSAPPHHAVLSVQVLTSKQVAIQVVHAYPRLLEKPRLLEVLAALNEEPPAKVLAQSMGLDDLQHAANWQQVEEYLKSFTVKDLNRHVPLVHST